MQHLGTFLQSILAMLFSAGVLALLLFFAIAVVNSVIKGIYEKRFPDEERRKNLVETIDDSVKGYRDRIRTEHSGVINWECRSRRFSFHITLKRDAKSYILNVSFPCSIQSIESRAAARVDLARKVKVADRNSLTAIEVDQLFLPLKFFDRVSVRESGIYARKVVRPEHDLQRWREALIGIIGFVRYSLDAEKWSDIERAVETLCPYCRAPMEEQDTVARCRKCRTAHHEECWHEQGRCSVFGCANTSHT